MSVKQRQKEIIEEFEVFRQWIDRYEHIIELGKNLPKLNIEHKTDKNLIDGCQSKVWLHVSMQKGRIIFNADSDTIIIKGIISLLIKVLSNQTPNEIINANLNFIEKIGLNQYLSPTRANGLMSMIKTMKQHAITLISNSER